MSIEASRIEQLEAELVIARGHLKLAGDADHARLSHIAELERRIVLLQADLAGERAANAALRDGVTTALHRLRAIEAAYEAADIAMFGS